MGNILERNTSPISESGTYSTINSFYNETAKSSFFQRRINTILLNRKDVINGRVTYVNLIKYTCRVATIDNISFDLYNSMDVTNLSNNTNTQIINIRLVGIRNFLPYITVESLTTDSFIYIFDNFILPISVPVDYTWPADFPQNPGDTNAYNFKTLCKIDMPEICAKQYYDNNSITVDSYNNFIWNYNVSRSIIPSDNLSNLIISLSGTYAPDNIYISDTTLNNFDYLGNFMKNSDYTINSDIMTSSNWITNGKYYKYIYFNKMDSINIFSVTDINLKITTFINSRNTDITKLYSIILKCIIINNFLLQGNAYRLLSSNDKTFNIGEPICTCLNSGLGYNLNVAPISGNKLNPSNYSTKSPFIDKNNNTFNNLDDYIDILNNPFDYRLKIAQNYLQYYFYDKLGNYITPQKLTTYSTVYGYDNIPISPPPSIESLWDQATGYSAYRDISSQSITLSRVTTDHNFNNTNANIYSINTNLSAAMPLTDPSMAKTDSPYSLDFVFKNDNICSSLVTITDPSVEIPYYIQKGPTQNITINCTNNINVYDNSSEYINIQGIVQNNICGNSGNVNATFNTYIDGTVQGEYSCFNANVTTGAKSSKTILVSGFNFTLNNNSFLSYSLFSGINGTYQTPLTDSTNTVLNNIMDTVGSDATIYIKKSPTSTLYDLTNTFLIIFTKAKSSDDTNYIIMIYQVINGTSVLILSSKLINYISPPSSGTPSDDFCMKMDFLSCELLFKKIGRSIYDSLPSSSYYLSNSFDYFLQHYDTSKMDDATKSMVNTIYTNFSSNNSFFQKSTYIQEILQTKDDISTGFNYFTSYLKKYSSNIKYIPQYEWKYEVDASSLINKNPISKSSDSLSNNGLLVYGLNMPAPDIKSSSTTQFLLTDSTDYTKIQLRPTYYILSEKDSIYYGAGVFDATETNNLAPYMYITDYANSDNPDILAKYDIDTNINTIIDTNSINGVDTTLKIIYSAALYRYILFSDTSILGVSSITNEQLSRTDYNSTPELDNTNSLFTNISNNNLNQIDEIYFNTKNKTSDFVKNSTDAANNNNWQVISQNTFNKRLGLIYTNNINTISFTLTDSNQSNSYFDLINYNYKFTVDPKNVSEGDYSVYMQLENYYWIIYINEERCFRSNSTLYDFDFQTNYINKSNDPTYWINLNTNSYNFSFINTLVNILEFDLNPDYFSKDPENLDDTILAEVKTALDTFIDSYSSNLIIIQSNIFYQKSTTNDFSVYYFIEFNIEGTINNNIRTYGNFLNELIKSTDSVLQNFIQLYKTSDTLMLNSQILYIANVKNYYTKNDFINNDTETAYDKTSNLAIASFNIYDTINSGYFFYEFPQIDIINDFYIDSFILATSDDIDEDIFRNKIYYALSSNPVFNINGPIVKIETQSETAQIQYTIYYSFINKLIRPITSDDNIGVFGKNIQLYNFITNNSTTISSISTNNYTPVNLFVNDLITTIQLTNYTISVIDLSNPNIIFSNSNNLSDLIINKKSSIIIDKYNDLIKFYNNEQTNFTNFLNQFSILQLATITNIKGIITQYLLSLKIIIDKSIQNILDICEYTDTVDNFINYLYQNPVDSFFTPDNMFNYNIFCNLLPYLAYNSNYTTINISTILASGSIAPGLATLIISKTPSVPSRLTDAVSACNTFDTCLSAMTAVNNYLLPNTKNNNNNKTKSSSTTIYIVAAVIIILVLTGLLIYFKLI